MEYFVQQTINALSVGGEYALLALGLAIVFSIMNLVNFAHGELITLGGYAMLFSAAWFVSDPIYLLPICVLAATGAAILFERVAFRPVRNAPETTGLLTAFGVSIVVQNALLIFVATRPKPVPIPDWMQGTIQIAGLHLPMVQVLETSCTVVAATGLILLLTKTNLGLAMRAAAKDFTVVRLMGIKADRVILGAFAVSGFLAGLAAVFILARRGAVDPMMGFSPVLKAFVACVLGGFGSLLGAAVGGLSLGMLEVLLQATLPSEVAGFRDAIVFLLVGAVLIWRPTGLLGKRVELGDKE
ncbi:branched-chain amino acid ABC transporter permease [Methyloligella sp. 2.7D]|uniref:branched-chain amino acid ABC transporter permease n=1 Tax=unclassified Methyloligella TaxID=2625955 RepID=UPI00157C6018|nr:branched-chain amino acid ABC transporter permease [Methyloligella sp. GL2]QKP77945.1 branched-chain amino acid ABC transporter permease [Methyloligella sp. GL2]